MSTINISIPKKLLADAKSTVKKRGYASVSELVRDALRQKIYDENQITINDFPLWFEKEVLESEKSTVVGKPWKSEEDIKNYFRKYTTGVNKTNLVLNDKDKNNG